MKIKNIKKIVLALIVFVMLMSTISLKVSAKVSNIVTYGFDAKYYLDNNADIKYAFGEDNYEKAYWHFINYGIKEGRTKTSPAFDVKYYLEKNVDIRDAFGEKNYEKAYWHFVNYGVSEGRKTSPTFDVRHYLANNADIRNAFGERNFTKAHWHFVNYGKNETRKLTDHVYGEDNKCIACGYVKEHTHDEVLKHIGEVKNTCTIDGYKEYWVCESCGVRFSDEAATTPVVEEDMVIKAGHNFIAKYEITPKTCEQDGEYLLYCENCGTVETEEDGKTAKKHVEAKGHVYQKDENGEDILTVKEATCSEYGYESKMCTVCGKTETKTLAKLPHDYETKFTWAKNVDGTEKDTYTDGDVTFEAVCKNNASHKIACNAAVTSEVVKEATCEETGIVKYTAKVTINGENYEDSKEVSTDALGHDWSEKVTAVLPNGDKTEVRTCQREGCEKIDSQRVHTGLAGTPIRTVKEATCKEAGEDEYYCSNCGEIVKVATPVLTTHKSTDVEHIEAVSATCAGNGNIEYWHCKKCDKYFSDEALKTEIEADTIITTHTKELSKVEAVSATCTTEGKRAHWECTCGACYEDEEGTKPIEAANTVIPVSHTLEHVEAKDATCTEDGNIEYWHCTSTCGKYFEDVDAKEEIEQADTVIEAAHTWEIVGTKADCEDAFIKCTATDCEHNTANGTLVTELIAIKDNAPITQKEAEELKFVKTVDHDTFNIQGVKKTEYGEEITIVKHCALCNKDIEETFEGTIVNVNTEAKLVKALTRANVAKIVLSDNIELTAVLKISNNVTIDLGTKTLTAKKDQAAFTIDDTKTLTVINGTITYTAENASNGDGTLKTNSTVTMNKVVEETPAE